MDSQAGSGLSEERRKERTFAMLKNDGVMRRLVGKIVSRLERKGLYLVQAKMVVPTMEILREHYAEHVEKKFFEGMAERMCASQVFPMIWEGKNAVAVVRKIIGATDPEDAAVGTIRGDFCMDIGRNLIHGADSKEAAEREIRIWFGEGGDCEVKQFDADIIYE